MNQNNSLIRTLSPIEEAFTITNETFPLSVVCVLHLKPGPESQDIEKALQQLQSRHQLLRAGISVSAGKLHFQQLNPVPPIPFTIVNRTDANSYRSITEGALNTTFDKAGPLMKCWLLAAPDQEACELIVCFHHAIIDGISARLMLHELLSICGGTSLPAPLSQEVIPEFPPDFQNKKFIKRFICIFFEV